MEVQEISRDDIHQIARLLRVTFPESQLSVEYLNWLYFANPLGEVVGYNAFEDDELVSHYACIPIRVGKYTGLLSVNTATHPNHRSKGLYRKLANLTYEKQRECFTFVIGVANSQSAPVFLKHLGFQEIGRLNLRLGRIRIPQGTTRVWDAATLNWRLASPKSNYKLSSYGSGIHKVSTRIAGLPFDLKTMIATRVLLSNENHKAMRLPGIALTVDWNRRFRPKIQLPNKLKPSPLVLIIKFLGEEVFELDTWGLLDFDAF